MFAEISGNRKVLIEFSYTKNEKHPERVNTAASLRINEENKQREDMTVLGSAVALQGKKDKFNRNEGRKVALTKALVNANLNRHDRSLVWLAFWSRSDRAKATAGIDQPNKRQRKAVAKARKEAKKLALITQEARQRVHV